MTMAHQAGNELGAFKVGDTYRGWSITWDYGHYTATGPDYDASYEGEEDGWVDNGHRVTARTREGLIEEVDAWFEENKPQATPGPYTLHPYSTPEWQDVPAGETHPAFKHASLAIGAGNKIVGFVQAQTAATGYPQVESLDEMRANHALFCAAPDLVKALQAICDMQARLYGDGMRTHMALIDLCESARATLQDALKPESPRQ